MRDSLSRQILLSIFGLAIVVIAIVGVSYAIMITSYKNGKSFVFNHGQVFMSSTRESNQILISNRSSMSDTEGMKMMMGNQVFDFTVSSLVDKNSTVHYEIVAEKVEIDGAILDFDQVRIYLEKLVDGEYVAVPLTVEPSGFVANNANGTMTLYYGTFENSDDWKKTFTDNYRLRVWALADDSFDAVDRSFQIRVNTYDRNL